MHRIGKTARDIVRQRAPQRALQRGTYRMCPLLRLAHALSLPKQSTVMHGGASHQQPRLARARPVLLQMKQGARPGPSGADVAGD